MQFMQTRANSRLLKNDGGFGTLGSLGNAIAFRGLDRDRMAAMRRANLWHSPSISNERESNHAARRVEMACELPEL